MNRAIVFGIVAAAGIGGGVVGAAAVGKAPKKVLSSLGYAPLGGLLFAAVAAAILWEPPPPCPPCPTTTTIFPTLPDQPVTVTNQSTNVGIP
jgi:hypothetical protein